MTVSQAVLAGHPSALHFVATRLAAGLRPRAPVPFAAWLPDNIVLVDGKDAGRPWTARGAPYLVEIADCLSDDHPSTLVTVRKSAQTGASILAMAWCLYIADREPANTLFAAPSLDALRDLNSGKLQPLIEAWHRRIRREVIVPQTSRSGTGSTTFEKVYPGGRLFLANANSPVDLASKTIKKGIKDELSKWQDIPGYGDPEKLFFSRFTAFRGIKEFKILEISTPEIDSGDDAGDVEGHCRIDRSFRRSDQRFWHVRCPACGTPFVQTFECLDIDAKAPHRTVMQCPHCPHRIDESERRQIIQPERGARWVATAEGEGRHPGFHIDAFISTMMSYEAIAENWLASTTETARKGFYNETLGLPFRYRGDAPDHQRLMERREDYPENRVPAPALLLVAGCDVQHDGIWCELVGFGDDRQSWCVTRRFLPGDTTDPDRGAFTALSLFYEETWPDAFGGRRRIDALAIDASDGGRASQVYMWTRKRDRAFAIKGVPGWLAPAIGTPTKVDISLRGKKISNGALLWPVGTWPLKAELYANLRKVGRAAGQEQDPPGYCHFGIWLDEPYFKQITSEYLATETFRGRTRRVWKEAGPNHLLDCRVYAMAMAEYLGLTRMPPAGWAKLRAERSVPLPLAQPDLLAPETVKASVDNAESALALAAPVRRALIGVRDSVPSMAVWPSGPFRVSRRRDEES